MAEDTETFPSLPAKQWWAIRDRFKRSMPPTITPGYIESALNVEGKTARDIVTQLRTLKLIDSEGKPSDIAEDWRHDDTYANACQAMRTAVYPEELLHASPTPYEDRKGAERWFARRKRVGENAALKMAITYALVSEADLSKVPEPGKGNNGKLRDVDRPTARARKSSTALRSAGASPSNPPAAPSAVSTVSVPAALPSQTGPTLHIDVQVHIAADATVAQIDQIFASMAKHLYKQSSDTNGT
jgi:hypothetical protein